MSAGFLVSLVSPMEVQAIASDDGIAALRGPGSVELELMDGWRERAIFPLPVELEVVS